MDRGVGVEMCGVCRPRIGSRCGKDLICGRGAKTGLERSRHSKLPANLSHTSLAVIELMTFTMDNHLRENFVNI